MQLHVMDIAMSKDLSIELKYRTVKDRSLIYYSDLSNKYPLEKILSLFKLSKAAIETLELMFARRLFADESNDFTQSILDFSHDLEVTPHVLSRRISKLVKQGILTPVNFRYVDKEQNTKRAKIGVYHFFPDISLASEKAVESSSENKGPINRSISVKQINQFKRNHNFRELPNPTDSQIIGFSKFGENELIKHDQVVLPDTVKKNRHIFEYSVKQNDKKIGVFIQASAPSHARILNAFDYKVLYALYTLTHAYHNKNIGFYRESQIPIENNTPFHIDHICLILGKESRGGKDHEAIRESLTAILNTKLDIFLKEKDADGLYKQGQVSYVKKIEGASMEAPTIENDMVQFKGVYFRVEWNDSDFERIINDDHFVYPKEVFKSNNTIFLIYLNLRNLSLVFSKNPESRAMSFHRLSNFLRITSNSDLKQTLLKSFGVNKDGSINKRTSSFIKTSISEDKNKVSANLWGFHITLDMVSEVMLVDPNYSEITLHCGLSGSQRAPTMKNALQSISVNNNNSLLKQIRLADAAYEIASSLSPKGFHNATGYTTKTLTYSVEYKKGPSILTLTRYSNDDEYFDIIKILNANVTLSKDTLYKFLKQCVEKVGLLKVDDQEIPLSVFSILCDHLAAFGITCNESDLCLFMIRRKSFNPLLLGLTRGEHPDGYVNLMTKLVQDFAGHVGVDINVDSSQNSAIIDHLIA